mmetsp:Transcript_18379/g.53086  ORF Transcript_18379/g.53086 Transcript_18379/m.53086 type:complete len:580 (+) Transcript_18379:80-1819(+)
MPAVSVSSLHEAEAGAPAGDGDGVERSCVRAIRTGKCHLQVCLKLLGILYQGDEDTGTSSWVGGTVGDDLYLAMVMLNSSLLKALHVVDSFHVHCRREMPRAMDEESDGSKAHCSAEQEELAPFPEEEDEDEHGAATSALAEDSRTRSQTSNNDRRSEAVAGGGMATVRSRDYRRLQAQCVVLVEALRSLEQQHGLEAAHAERLDKQCRSMRSALNGERAAQEPTPPPPQRRRKAAPPPSEEQTATETVSIGDALDVVVEKRRAGDVVMAGRETRRLVSHLKALKSQRHEAQDEVAVAQANAAAASARLQAFAEEEEALRILLGCASVEDLAPALEQLASETEQLQSLVVAEQAQLDAVEGGSTSGERPERQTPQTPQTQPEQASEVPRQPLQREVQQQPQHHRSATPQCGATSSSAVARAPLRPTVVGGRSAPQPAVHMLQQQLHPQQPQQQQQHARLVGLGAPASSQPKAAARLPSAPRGAADVVQRRAAYGALLEERQLTRAALKYAKHRDSQALGRLASLLGGGVRPEALPPSSAGAAAVVDDRHGVRVATSPQRLAAPAAQSANAMPAPVHMQL